ncbi:MAG TPA: hypothetical protein VF212_04525 [Longimicrobiales bacterium]
MRIRTNVIPCTLALTLSLLGAGCADRGTDAVAAGDTAAADTATTGTPPAAALPPRPDTIHSTILLEGMADSMTYWLYRSPPAFPVPFTTYVPADMAAEPVASGEGDAFRFVAEFGGVRNEQAFLAVAFPPAGVDEAGARELARAFAAQHEIRARRPDVPRRYAWSLEEWDFSRGLPDGRTAIGTVALGRHGDRYFYVATHFPEAYADGFGPRVERILDEWRWEDTGEGLGGASPDK